MQHATRLDNVGLIPEVLAALREPSGGHGAGWHACGQVGLEPCCHLHT